MARDNGRGMFGRPQAEQRGGLIAAPRLETHEFVQNKEESLRRTLTFALIILVTAGCKGRQAAEQENKDALTGRLVNGEAYWTSEPWESMKIAKELEGWRFLADGTCRYYEQQTREEPVTRRQAKGTWKVLGATGAGNGTIEVSMAFRFAGPTESKEYALEVREGGVQLGTTRYVPCPEFAANIDRLDRDGFRAPLPGP